MPTLPDLQETPDPAGVSLDVPNIITSLNTDTGPQANPSSFGFDMGGLAQSLGHVTEDLSATTRHLETAELRSESAQASQQRRTDTASGQLWAGNAALGIQEKYDAYLANLRANGQPFDPAAFQQSFRGDVNSVIDPQSYSQNGGKPSVAGISGPPPNSIASQLLQHHALEMEAGYFSRGVDYNATLNLQDRNAQFRSLGQFYLQQVTNGKMSADDAYSALGNLAHGVAPVTPNASAVTQQVGAQMYQADLQNIAKSQGPATAASMLLAKDSNGNYSYAPGMLDDVQRQTMATVLSNQSTNDHIAHEAIATKAVGATENAAAAGQDVSIQNQFASATNAARASTAPLAAVPLPSLIDVIQKERDAQAARDNVISGDFPEAQSYFFGKIEDAKLTNMVQQRLLAMPPAQMLEQSNQLIDAFGTKDPVVANAAKWVQATAKKLVSGADYDPVGVALRRPDLNAALSSANNAMDSAMALPPASPDTAKALGAARGALNIAIEKSFAAQRQMGIPSGEEAVLDKAHATDLASKINNVGAGATGTPNAPDSSQNPNPPDVVAMIGQVRDKYGVYAPQVFRDLQTLPPKGQGLGIEAQYIAALPPGDQRALLIAQAMKTPKQAAGDAVAGIPATWSSQANYQKIGEAVDTEPTVQSYVQTMMPTSPEDVKQTTAMIQRQADYILASGQAKDPEGAVKIAAANTIGALYAFKNGLRIPVLNDQGKTISDSDVASTTNGLDAIKQQLLSEKSIGLPAALQARVAPITDPDMRSKIADSAIRNETQWQTTPDGTGARLMYGFTANNQFMPLGQVKTIRGQPIAVDYAQARDFDATRQQNDSAPNPSGAPLFSQRIPLRPAPLMPTPTIPQNPSGNANDSQSPSQVSLPPEHQGHQASEWLNDVESTHFGYENDPDRDGLSRSGVGAFNRNPLTPGAVALSPSAESKLHALPGDVIEMRDAQGNIRRGYFADRTSQALTNDRVDIYDPQGSEAAGAPFNAVAYRNLGGGVPGAQGFRVAHIGEANLRALESR